MERTPDKEPGGFETGSELRRGEPPPAPPTTHARRSNRRVGAVVLAVLVVGLLAYLLFTLL